MNGTELVFADQTLRQNLCLLIRTLRQNSLLFLLRSPEQTQTRVERETAWRVWMDREGESKTQQQRDLVRGFLHRRVYTHTGHKHRSVFGHKVVERKKADHSLLYEQ